MSFRSRLKFGISFLISHDPLRQKMSPANKSYIIPEANQYVLLKGEFNLNMGRFVKILLSQQVQEIRSCSRNPKDLKEFPIKEAKIPRMVKKYPHILERVKIYPHILERVIVLALVLFTFLLFLLSS